MKIPGAATLQRALFVLAGSPVIRTQHRYRLLRRLGLRGMDSPALGHGITFSNPISVTCGPGCFINNQVYFDAGPISLGTGVFIGPRALLMTGDHPIGGPRQRAGDGQHNAIRIGDGVWIGGGAIVLPGIHIAEGCVIGAGAVVTKDCESHGVYIGVPARRIRQLPPGGAPSTPKKSAP